MISRTYLPYKSAREYIDRGMAKWMGFFISEHSTALSKEKKGSPIPMDEEEKLCLLTQAFLYKFPILLQTNSEEKSYLGKIQDFSNGILYLNTTDKILSFPLSLISNLSLAETDDE